MTLIEMAAIIGAITGSVSLGIVIYKTTQERSKLSIQDKDAYHFPPLNENYNFHEFNVTLTVSNKGKRSTTIHSANLSFNFEGKTFRPEMSGHTYFIQPDSSEKISLNFHTKKEEFSKNVDLDNGTLELFHTHGKKTIQLQKIRNAK